MSGERFIRKNPLCRRGQLGLGFLEVILFLSLFVLVVGLLSPMVIQQIVNSRVESTRDEMQQIHAAIVGDLKAGTYGFVGDMGRLPLHLQELKAQPSSVPLYSAANLNGVGMGWSGPYVNFGKNADDYLLDGFGTLYDFGRAGVGQLRSAGPDLTMGTADDILVPPQPLNILGRLSVTIRVFDGQAYVSDPADCTVTVYYPENGAQRFISASAPPFVFENVARGLHAVTSSCGEQRNSGSAGATVTTAIQGFGQTNLCELTVPAGRGVAQVAHDLGGVDPLEEARELLGRQRSMVQQRADLSPALKSQFDLAQNRVLSSIDLAVRQRTSQDMGASQRNIQRALSELEVMYGFVRKSPLGSAKSKESQPLLEMEGQLKERLTKALPTILPAKPQS